MGLDGWPLVPLLIVIVIAIWAAFDTWLKVPSLRRKVGNMEVTARGHKAVDWVIEQDRIDQAADVHHRRRVGDGTDAALRCIMLGVMGRTRCTHEEMVTFIDEQFGDTVTADYLRAWVAQTRALILDEHVISGELRNDEGPEQ